MDIRHWTTEKRNSDKILLVVLHRRDIWYRTFWQYKCENIREYGAEKHNCARGGRKQQEDGENCIMKTFMFCTLFVKKKIREIKAWMGAKRRIEGVGREREGNTPPWRRRQGGTDKRMNLSQKMMGSGKGKHRSFFNAVMKVNFPMTFRDPQRLPKRRREIQLAHSAKTLKPEININSTVKV